MGLFSHVLFSPPIICRLQCGNSGIQEHLLHSLGRGRPGQDSASVEALLSEHSGGGRDVSPTAPRPPGGVRVRKTRDVGLVWAPRPG